MTTIHAKYTEAHSRPSEAYEAQVAARVAARRQAEQEALERQDREDAERFDEAERRAAVRAAASAESWDAKTPAQKRECEPDAGKPIKGKRDGANIVTVVLASAIKAATFEANKETGVVSIRTTHDKNALIRHQVMTIEEGRQEYRRLLSQGYKPKR